MRVCLFVTDLQPGGAPLRIASLARGLRDAGDEVFVGCLAGPGPVGAQLERDGIPTFFCDARGARDFIPALHNLLGHLRGIRPDVLHATLTHANVIACLAGAFLRIPVLTSTATIEIERRWHRWAERFCAWLDRGRIVNSRSVAEHVRASFRLSPARVHVVPPFVESIPARVPQAQARAALGLPTDGLLVLWAGRFDPVKRVELLIRAVGEIAGREEAARGATAKPIHLVLAGDGALREALQTLSRDVAQDRVHFLGWRENLSEAFSAADVLALPSLTEGMPNVVLQAMAFGLPVMGSSIPALRELAGENPAGSPLAKDDPSANRARRLFLVQEATPAATADALRGWAMSPEERQATASRAARWAEEHLSREVAIATLRAVYLQTLG